MLLEKANTNVSVSSFVNEASPSKQSGGKRKHYDEAVLADDDDSNSDSSHEDNIKESTGDGAQSEVSKLH